MRLTTKGRFAVTAMIDVALNGRDGPVNLASISRRQRISLSYLELLFAKLRWHKLVESTRGPGGGYSLARKPVDITVADIILSIEETETDASKQRPVDSAGTGTGRYAMDELWASVNRRAVEFLDSITLQSLVDSQKAKEVQVMNKPLDKRWAGQGSVKPPKIDAPNSVFALGGRTLAKR